MMHWPWVARSEHERMYAFFTAAIRERNEAYTGLLEKYHALKLAGAAASESQSIPEPETPPDILMRAIRTVSPRQDAAYLMNYRWAMDQKDRWTDETYMRECAAKILRGAGTADDSDPLTD